MTKMTITRALSKLKTLDTRLTTLKATDLFTHKVGSRLTGTTLNENQFAKTAQSVWDEYNSLSDARIAIKSAITQANSETEVIVNGEVMSIASAVDKKHFYPKLLAELTGVVNAYSLMSRHVEKHNQAVSERLDKMIESLVGKDKKMSDGELEAVSKPFLAQNEANIVDPFDVYEKTKQKIVAINAFLAEVDFVLSEANAKTEIDVELKFSV